MGDASEGADTLGELEALIGSLDTALTALSADANTNYDTLKEIGDAIVALQSANASLGDTFASDVELSQAVSDLTTAYGTAVTNAVAALVGTATADGDTLGELQALIGSLKSRLDALELPEAGPLDWADESNGFAVNNPADSNPQNNFTVADIFGGAQYVSVQNSFADVFAQRILGYNPATVPLAVTEPLTVAQATALSEAGFVLDGISVVYSIEDAYTTVQAALANPDQNMALTGAAEVVATGNELDNSVAMGAMDNAVSLRTELGAGDDTFTSGTGNEAISGGLGGDAIQLTYQNDMSHDSIAYGTIFDGKTIAQVDVTLPGDMHFYREGAVVTLRVNGTEYSYTVTQDDGETAKSALEAFADSMISQGAPLSDAKVVLGTVEPVFAALPNQYRLDYSDLDSEYWDDAGSDLYDEGNYLAIDGQTQSIWSRSGSSSEEAWGTYTFETYANGTLLTVENFSADRFKISGELGADGDGSREGGELAGFEAYGVRVFYTQTYGADDASLVKVYITDASAPVLQPLAGDTDDEYFELTSLSDATSFQYAMFAGDPDMDEGYRYTQSEISNFVNNLIEYDRPATLKLWGTDSDLHVTPGGETAAVIESAGLVTEIDVAFSSNPDDYPTETNQGHETAFDRELRVTIDGKVVTADVVYNQDGTPNPEASVAALANAVNAANQIAATTAIAPASVNLSLQSLSGIPQTAEATVTVNGVSYTVTGDGRPSVSYAFVALSGDLIFGLSAGTSVLLEVSNGTIVGIAAVAPTAGYGEDWVVNIQDNVVSYVALTEAGERFVAGSTGATPNVLEGNGGGTGSFIETISSPVSNFLNALNDLSDIASAEINETGELIITAEVRGTDPTQNTLDVSISFDGAEPITESSTAVGGTLNGVVGSAAAFGTTLTLYGASIAATDADAPTFIVNAAEVDQNGVQQETLLSFSANDADYYAGGTLSAVINGVTVSADMVAGEAATSVHNLNDMLRISPLSGTILKSAVSGDGFGIVLVAETEQPDPLNADASMTYRGEQQTATLTLEDASTYTAYTDGTASDHGAYVYYEGGQAHVTITPVGGDPVTVSVDMIKTQSVVFGATGNTYPVAPENSVNDDFEISLTVNGTTYTQDDFTTYLVNLDTPKRLMPISSQHGNSDIATAQDLVDWLGGIDGVSSLEFGPSQAQIVIDFLPTASIEVGYVAGSYFLGDTATANNVTLNLSGSRGVHMTLIDEFAAPTSQALVEAINSHEDLGFLSGASYDAETGAITLTATDYAKDSFAISDVALDYQGVKQTASVALDSGTYDATFTDGATVDNDDYGRGAGVYYEGGKAHLTITPTDATLGGPVTVSADMVTLETLPFVVIELNSGTPITTDMAFSGYLSVAIGDTYTNFDPTGSNTVGDLLNDLAAFEYFDVVLEGGKIEIFATAQMDGVSAEFGSGLSSTRIASEVFTFSFSGTSGAKQSNAAGLYRVSVQDNDPAAETAQLLADAVQAKIDGVPGAITLDISGMQLEDTISGMNEGIIVIDGNYDASSNLMWILDPEFGDATGKTVGQLLDAINGIDGISATFDGTHIVFVPDLAGTPIEGGFNFAAGSVTVQRSTVVEPGIEPSLAGIIESVSVDGATIDFVAAAVGQDTFSVSSTLDYQGQTQLAKTTFSTDASDYYVGGTTEIVIDIDADASTDNSVTISADMVAPQYSAKIVYTSAVTLTGSMVLDLEGGNQFKITNKSDLQIVDVDPGTTLDGFVAIVAAMDAVETAAIIDGNVEITLSSTYVGDSPAVSIDVTGQGWSVDGGTILTLNGTDIDDTGWQSVTTTADTSQSAAALVDAINAEIGTGGSLDGVVGTATLDAETNEITLTSATNTEHAFDITSATVSYAGVEQVASLAFSSSNSDYYADNTGGADEIYATVNGVAFAADMIAGDAAGTVQALADAISAQATPSAAENMLTGTSEPVTLETAIAAAVLNIDLGSGNSTLISGNAGGTVATLLALLRDIPGIASAELVDGGIKLITTSVGSSAYLDVSGAAVTSVGNLGYSGDPSSGVDGIAGIGSVSVDGTTITLTADKPLDTNEAFTVTRIGTAVQAVTQVSEILLDGLVDKAGYNDPTDTNLHVFATDDAGTQGTISIDIAGVTVTANMADTVEQTAQNLADRITDLRDGVSGQPEHLAEVRLSFFSPLDNDSSLTGATLNMEIFLNDLLVFSAVESATTADQTYRSGSTMQDLIDGITATDGVSALWDFEASNLVITADSSSDALKLDLSSSISAVDFVYTGSNGSRERVALTDTGTPGVAEVIQDSTIADAVGNVTLLYTSTGVGVSISAAAGGADALLVNDGSAYSVDAPYINGVSHEMTLQFSNTYLESAAILDETISVTLNGVVTTLTVDQALLNARVLSTDPDKSEYIVSKLLEAVIADHEALSDAGTPTTLDRTAAATAQEGNLLRFFANIVGQGGLSPVTAVVSANDNTGTNLTAAILETVEIGYDPVQASTSTQGISVNADDGEGNAVSGVDQTVAYSNDTTITASDFGLTLTEQSTPGDAPTPIDQTIVNPSDNADYYGDSPMADGAGVSQTATNPADDPAFFGDDASTGSDSGVTQSYVNPADDYTAVDGSPETGTAGTSGNDALYGAASGSYANNGVYTDHQDGLAALTDENGGTFYDVDRVDVGNGSVADDGGVAGVYAGEDTDVGPNIWMTADDTGYASFSSTDALTETIAFYSANADVVSNFQTIALDGNTLGFSWVGDLGYRIEGSMTFDPSTAAGQIAYAIGDDYTEGGQSAGVMDLMLSFIGPDGNVLETFNSVQNGVVTYAYLNFAFDLDTGLFVDPAAYSQDSYMDLGGIVDETGANYYTDFDLVNQTRFGLHLWDPETQFDGELDSSHAGASIGVDRIVLEGEIARSTAVGSIEAIEAEDYEGAALLDLSSDEFGIVSHHANAVLSNDAPDSVSILDYDQEGQEVYENDYSIGTSSVAISIDGGKSFQSYSIGTFDTFTDLVDLINDGGLVHAEMGSQGPFTLTELVASDELQVMFDLSMGWSDAESPLAVSGTYSGTLVTEPEVSVTTSELGDADAVATLLGYVFDTNQTSMNGQINTTAFAVTAADDSSQTAIWAHTQSSAGDATVDANELRLLSLVETIDNEFSFHNLGVNLDGDVVRPDVLYTPVS